MDSFGTPLSVQTLSVLSATCYLRWIWGNFWKFSKPFRVVDFQNWFVTWSECSLHNFGDFVNSVKVNVTLWNVLFLFVSKRNIFKLSDKECFPIKQVKGKIQIYLETKCRKTFEIKGIFHVRKMQIVYFTSHIIQH